MLDFFISLNEYRLNPEVFLNNELYRRDVRISCDRV